MEKVWYKKWWGILIIIFAILLTILISAIYLKAKQIKETSSEIDYSLLATNNLSKEKLKTINGINNYYAGSENPQITIVEFADFACGYCGKSYSKIREISVKHKNTVKLIFRDYPINTEQSLVIANAARCAGEQGLFWQAHDKLFQNQGISEKKDIKNLLKNIGLDYNQFENCFDNQKYLTDIKKDISDGQKLGITGTPTWFINGNIIKGDIPTKTWDKIIEELEK